MTDKTFRTLQRARDLIKSGKPAEAQQLLRTSSASAVEGVIAELVTELDCRGEGDQVKPEARLVAAEIMTRPRRRR